MGTDEFGHQYVIGVPVSLLQAADQLQRAMAEARQAAVAEQSALRAFAALEEWAADVQGGSEGPHPGQVSPEIPTTSVPYDPAIDDEVIDAEVVEEPQVSPWSKSNFLIGTLPVVAGTIFGSSADGGVGAEVVVGVWGRRWQLGRNK